MNRFLGVFVVLVLVAAAVVGLAYYQGWFHVTVDKGKFEEDRKDAMERMQDYGGSFKDNAASPKEKRRDQAVAQSDAQKESDAQKDMDKLQGTWRVVSLERNGETASDDAIREQDLWVFQGDKIVLDAQAKEGTSTYNVDPAKAPKTIDVFSHDRAARTIPGIYSLDRDILKLCLSAPANNDRPTEFSAKKGSLNSFYILKRETP